MEAVSVDAGASSAKYFYSLRNIDNGTHANSALVTVETSHVERTTAQI